MKYYKDTMDGVLVRESQGQYEVWGPRTGAWKPFEPSYECYLHLQEITPAQAQAAGAKIPAAAAS